MSGRKHKSSGDIAGTAIKHRVIMMETKITGTVKRREKKELENQQN